MKPRSPRRICRLIVCLSLSLAIGACSDDANTSDPSPTITITSPAQGELVTTERVMVRGRAEHTEEIMVNGTPASVVGGQWSAAVTVAQGMATVTATDNDVTETVTFTVDSMPPTLTMTSPARAAWIPQEDGTPGEVTVSGNVSDETTGVETVRVGELLVETDAEGNFETTAALEPGLNDIRISVLDQAGNESNSIIGVMHGPFIDAAEPIDPGFDIVLNAQTFPKIAEVVSELITPMLVSELVTQNLMIDGVDITSIAFDPLDIEATPRSDQLNPNGPGFIDFTVAVTNLTLEGTFTFGSTMIGLEVSVAEANVVTSMKLAADGAGSLDLSFGEAELDLPADSLTWTVKTGDDSLSQEDSDLLSGIVENIARVAFSELLSERIIEQLYDPALLQRTVEILGSTLEFTLVIEEVITNASGVLFRTTVSMPDNPIDGIPKAPGALNLPVGSANAPILDTDAFTTVNQTAANRLLHGVWTAGLLNQELAGDAFAGFELPVALEAGALALVLDGRVTDYAESSSPAALALRPQFPPLIELSEGDTGSGLALRLSELHVDVLLDAASAEPTRLVTLAMFLEVGLDLSIEDSLLSFDVDVSGEADVVDEPLFDLDDRATQDLLNGVIAFVPQILTESLTLGSEAELSWLTLKNPEVVVHGLQNDHMSIGLDVEANPEGLDVGGLTGN